MAVLMKRLSENQVVDAATVEGFTAAELAPRAAFNSNGDAPDGADFTLSTTITAPARGNLILSGTVDASNFTAFDNYGCSLEIDDGLVLGTVMLAELNGNNLGDREEDCTTTGAAVVDAGTYTIDFEVFGVVGTTILSDAAVWALWVPFDGNGNKATFFALLDD